MTKDNVAGLTAGSLGTTFPWWGQLLEAATSVNQVLVGTLGLIILILTLRKVWIEGQIASRRLRDMDEGR
jgi:hypothetical protein